MNARQKAKKYKKELNRLKGLLNPRKMVKVPYTQENMRLVKYHSAVCISYNNFEHNVSMSEAFLENVTKDRLLEPLIEELKNSMKVEVTRDDINQVFHCHGYLGVYVESEDKNENIRGYL